MRSLLRCLTLLSALLLPLAACQSEGEAESGESEIIGGTDASRPAFDAIGKIEMREDDRYPVAMTCTGTLVAPQIVMTARHCRVYAAEKESRGARTAVFIIGDRKFEVERELTTGPGGHGFLGRGRDASLYFLKEPVPGALAKPIAVRERPLDATDEGKRLLVVGYGRGADGKPTKTRTKGQSTLDSASGRPYERAFGTKGAFRAFVADAFSPAVAPTVEYDLELDAESYEVHGGLAKGGGMVPGDVQPCFGDSGGPLLDRVGDHYELVGVTTGGERECALGTVYTAMGSEVQEALRASMTASPPWSWACPAAAKIEGLEFGQCVGQKSMFCGSWDDPTIEVENCSALGDGFSCVADALPSSRCQRSNVPGAPPPIASDPSALVQLVMRQLATCTLRRSGEVACRGLGGIPGAAGGDPEYQRGKIMLTDAVQLATGDHETFFALRRDGSVVYWGGDGSLSGIVNEAVRTQLAGLVEISGTCGRRANGTVGCWSVPWVGATDIELDEVPGIEDATAVAGRCALRRNGHVACWGDNRNGQLGIGLPDEAKGIPKKSDVPVEVIGLTDATSITRGGGSGGDVGARVCATRKNGHVVCWGKSNEPGCAVKGCADGPTYEVDHITDAVSVAISSATTMNWNRTCALRTGGLVSCWGYTDDYHAAPWSSPFRRTPIELTELSNVSKLADAGPCAITDSGHAIDCWSQIGNAPVGWLRFPGSTYRPRRLPVDER